MSGSLRWCVVSPSGGCLPLEAHLSDSAARRPRGGVVEAAAGCVVSPSGGCLLQEAHPNDSCLGLVRRVSFRRLSPSGGPPMRSVLAACCLLLVRRVSFWRLSPSGGPPTCSWRDVWCVVSPSGGCLPLEAHHEILESGCRADPGAWQQQLCLWFTHVLQWSL